MADIDIILCGKKRRRRLFLFLLTLLTVAGFLLCLLVGSSGISVSECIACLLGRSEDRVALRIIWNIRLPRALAALIAGAGLAAAGLVMQTNLSNAMASPSTLGVSNAAVFGANLSIIALAGGYLDTGNQPEAGMVSANPYATSLLAFVFAFLSVLVILGLCSLGSFSPGTVVLAGVAIGSVWTAGTTLLQFYATDVGLSAAVLWNFGDLGRATYRTDGIMLLVVVVGLVFFALCSWRYNALLSGDAVAVTMGIRVKRLRFFSLLTASLITAVCVSFLGIIGFVGILCPHIVKLLFGEDHRLTLPGSALAGSILLLLADSLSRSIGGGTALPVGAVTTLLGAPFFLTIILMGGRKKKC